MEYSIQEVARAAGTTSRTLRHYDDVGLIPPSRIGRNGYRYYDNAALIRLQRVLLLRQLGLGLDAIRDVLTTQDAGPTIEARVLSEHLEILREEQRRLAAQIGSVERTIAALTTADAEREGRNLMTENIFDGFDHMQHREEVERRWGKSASEKSDQWWRELSTADRRHWSSVAHQLTRDWARAARDGEDPASPVAHELAQRQVAWLRSVPGTPAHEDDGLVGYLLGLGDLYVADERFAANYGGVEGATFVRDALRHYVESTLGHPGPRA